MTSLLQGRICAAGVGVGSCWNLGDTAPIVNHLPELLPSVRFPQMRKLTPIAIVSAIFIVIWLSPEAHSISSNSAHISLRFAIEILRLTQKLNSQLNYLHAPKVAEIG